MSKSRGGREIEREYHLRCTGRPVRKKKPGKKHGGSGKEERKMVPRPDRKSF